MKVMFCMKRVFCSGMVLWAVMACTMFLLTACEEHDGIDYFKSKCVAELNGQTYVDQTPFTVSPDVIVTPQLECSENDVTFMTSLSGERNGTALYVVGIHIFVSAPEIFLGKEQTIERVDIDYPNGEPSDWDYILYCEKNKISYARVNGEVADKGSFRITSYDKEEGRYNGTFTLHFSEGTIKGEFWI